MKHRPETTYGTVNADVLADKDPDFQRGSFLQCNSRITVAKLTMLDRKAHRSIRVASTEGSRQAVPVPAYPAAVSIYNELSPIPAPHPAIIAGVRRLTNGWHCVGPGRVYWCWGSALEREHGDNHEVPSG
jgi:hypothetical protein